MKWYSKRVAVTAVYKSTELSLMNDKSPGFAETWSFLDRRISDMERFLKCEDQVKFIFTMQYKFNIAKHKILTPLDFSGNVWGINKFLYQTIYGISNTLQHMSPSNTS